jgi:hypothetical protein
MKKVIAGVALAAFGLFGWGMASAAVSQGYCSASGYLGYLDTSDVTLGGSASDDCYGVASGNPGADSLDGLWSTDWTYLAKDNVDGVDESNTYLGLTWTVSKIDNDDWQISWTGSFFDPENKESTLPALFDFAVLIKAADYWGVYLFEDFLVETSPIGGSYIVSWGKYKGNLCNAGIGDCTTSGLSHISLYGNLAGYPPPPPPPDEVPLPGAIWLFGSALLGFVTWSRRRTA